MTSAENDEPPARAGYRRSTGSPRGEARRRELLDLVTDDVATNGLVEFSLRRAARAAGTTHKVLLYHFTGADELLVQVIRRLRERRIENSLAAAGPVEATQRLSARVRAIWPILIADEGWVLDQAIGLALYDPARYSELGRGASQHYLPSLLLLCPPGWSEERKLQVSEMILATLRGFLIDRMASEGTAGVDAGLEALGRALDREEASPD